MLHAPKPHRQQKTKIIGAVSLLLVLAVMAVGCSERTNEPTDTAAVIDNLQTTNTQLEASLLAKTLELRTLSDDMLELKSENDQLRREMSLPAPEIATLPVSANPLLTHAIAVAGHLKNQNMASLRAHIHPTKGVRLSPYPHVDMDQDLVFTASQISTALSSNILYTWGSFDGTGDPIQLSFLQYLNRFIYNHDFLDAHVIGQNRIIGLGNTPSNLETVYPDANYVDFHFYGFHMMFDGMDWSSLRLVFEKVGGTWYLVGIVHGEWTI